jgi:glutathione peroxidase
MVMKSKAVIDRRMMMLGAGCALLPVQAHAQSNSAPAFSNTNTAWRFDFPSLHGGDIRLKDYANRPILVTNTASFCGFASQLESLEQLWTRYGPRGLMVIGVPSGDFGGQEADNPADIAHQAEQGHGTHFPLTAKQHVKGDAAHPFYKWAAQQKPNDLPKWNFHKYLIGRDGQIAAVFGTMTNPTEARVISAILKELDSKS